MLELEATWVTAHSLHTVGEGSGLGGSGLPRPALSFSLILSQMWCPENVFVQDFKFSTPRLTRSSGTSLLLSG